MSQYIYLLREREFIKTNEEIYKVGMTKKENFERFNQYPKGSLLLFQMICNDCANIEKDIIKIFKEKFIQKKNIGTEYFEGDFNEMIEIIYSTIKNFVMDSKISDECSSKCEKIIQDEDEDEDEDDDDEDKLRYEIKTFKEWFESNKISNLIITNKKGEGYFRFNGSLWHKLYDRTKPDFDVDYMEELSGLIEHYQPTLWKIDSFNSKLYNDDELTNYKYSYINNETNERLTIREYYLLDDSEKKNYSYKKQKINILFGVDYNIEKIRKDTIKECYVKNYEYYKLKPYEYVFSDNSKGEVIYYIFNSQKFKFTNVDELINEKILTKEYRGERNFTIKNICNINIVDQILDSLIETETKNEYKKLLQNIIFTPNEKTIIFNDYDTCLMSTWINDLLYSISGNYSCVYSEQYYEDKKNIIKQIETKKTRLIIITYKSRKYNSVEKQKDTFLKLGIRNIIVQYPKSNLYRLENYRNYLKHNKDLIMQILFNESAYIPSCEWESEIQHDDSIFYRSSLLMTNFLKWICIS